MKVLAPTIASLCLIAVSSAQGQPPKSGPGSKPMLTRDDVRMVAPALERYTQGALLGELWKRPGLSPRDRSIVTVAVMIARNQTIEMPDQFGLALDNGVKPSEISEIITHLAFYSGWANAMSAVAVAKDVFAERKIGADQLRRLTAASSARRGGRGGTRGPRRGAFRHCRSGRRAVHHRRAVPRPVAAAGPGAAGSQPGHGQRPDRLRPVAQLPCHLNRAMDNGLTQAEAAEVITHLAFYAGWPNVFSALPVAKECSRNAPNST